MNVKEGRKEVKEVRGRRKEGGEGKKAGEKYGRKDRRKKVKENEGN